MWKQNKELYLAKKQEIMEKCYECYAKKGLARTGLKTLADYCGISKASIYTYFDSLDDLIIQSTAYCMTKVEDGFMQLSPQNSDDIIRFLEEVPYWTVREHGKKYRLMYQVYTHPKYIEEGKKFFEGVNERYTQYAKRLEPKLGIPYQVITPLIFIFVRALVHYTMFEDEYYLKSQIGVLKESIFLLREKYMKKNNKDE